MCSHIFKVVVTALFTVLLAGTCVIANAQPQPPSPADIFNQQKALRVDIAGGKGAFKGISKSERDALLRKQDEVLSLLDGRQSFEELRLDQRTTVFNHLEFIKAAVTKAEDERLVCEYTRTVGSNRAKSVCMTAKQQREHRENSQKSLRLPVKCQGADTLGCKNELGGSLGGGSN